MTIDREPNTKPLPKTPAEAETEGSLPGRDSWQVPSDERILAMLTLADNPAEDLKTIEQILQSEDGQCRFAELLDLIGDPLTSEPPQALLRHLKSLAQATLNGREPLSMIATDRKVPAWLKEIAHLRSLRW